MTGLEVTRAVDRQRRLTHRVVVSGELDLSTAGMLRDELTQTLDEGALLVLVDASQVSFVDSAGLRTLITARNDFEEHGGRLVLEETGPTLDRLLELTGLHHHFRDGQFRDGHSSNGSDGTSHDGTEA